MAEKPLLELQHCEGTVTLYQLNMGECFGGEEQEAEKIITAAKTVARKKKRNPKKLLFRGFKPENLTILLEQGTDIEYLDPSDARRRLSTYCVNEAIFRESTGRYSDYAINPLTYTDADDPLIAIYDGEKMSENERDISNVTAYFNCDPKEALIAVFRLRYQ